MMPLAVHSIQIKLQVVGRPSQQPSLIQVSGNGPPDSASPATHWQTSSHSFKLEPGPGRVPKFTRTAGRAAQDPAKLIQLAAIYPF